MLTSELTGLKPWGIGPAELRSLVRRLVIADLAPEVLAAMKEASPKSEGDSPDVLPGGVAVIRAHGPIFQRAEWWHRYISATSYEAIQRDLKAASTNPEVKSILMDIDSPGGMAAGGSEAFQAVRAAAKGKPVVAYTGGAMCSAAYHVGCGASEVVVGESTVTGSIGTLSVYYDDRAFMEKMGIKEIVIVSTLSPNKYPDPATEAGVAQIRAVIDDFASLFIREVAIGRGVSRDTVKSDFGKGDIMIGRKAVSAGLADRIGSFDSVLSQLAAGYEPKRATRMVAQSRGKPMGLKHNLMNWLQGQTDDDEANSESDHEAGTPPPEAEAKEEARPKEVQAEAKVTDPALVEALAKIAKLEATAKAAVEAQVKSEARSFALGEIRAGRCDSSQKSHLEMAYLDAARDDADHPRKVSYLDAKGEPATGTRLDSLKARHASMGSSGMTREWAGDDEESDTGYRALDNEDADDILKEVDALVDAYADRGKSARRN